MTDSIDVLLVDEDRQILELTETLLERKSDRIAVETEPDATAAPDRAVEGGFDCVVSDYRMPGMDGIELCSAIRERAELPFVLFTGVSAAEVDDDAPVTAHVQKGAGTDRYDELVEHIERACE